MHTLFISRPIVKDGEQTVQFKQCLTLREQITNKLFCVNLIRGGGTPIHYLYGYVPPNGVVILKLLI